MKNNSLKQVFIVAIFMFAIILLLSNFVEGIIPSGATVNQIQNSTALADPAGVQQAVAGNVTEVNLEGSSSTQSWQGYYGNVTGKIQLSNGNNEVLYNWDDTNPKGEIYASTISNIDWTNIQCFNFTAKGTFADDTQNRGGTSQFGLNLTQLEDEFNISYDAVDSIDKTFNLSGSGNHQTFYTSNFMFSDGVCQSTRLYTNLGHGVSGKFEEVLLYDPTSKGVVYTSLLNQDILGFDNRTHDFEMIVPEDGHGTDTSTTPYYFYMELQ